MTAKPRVLCVHTSLAAVAPPSRELFDASIDYRICSDAPRVWRRLERLLRFDLLLAIRAKQLAKDFDVIWAGSEIVGLPLACLRPQCPIITIAHRIGAFPRRQLLRATGLHRAWRQVGYLCGADRAEMQALGFPPDRLFRHASAPADEFAPAAPTPEGAVLAAGVSKRDYRTFFAALSEIGDCRAEVYAWSLYGDKLRDGQAQVPPCVTLSSPVPRAQMPAVFSRAAFVVVPLLRDKQYSAGMTVIFEAACAARAVIATRTPGTEEFVVDRETGMLVPPGDPVALAQAIRELKRNPELAAE
ncbi:MAG TPA: glycosyltransferase, partial [Candidatus Acidoferrales bacterium]|nr:glycosyltransferase [Candidatus Acidoferrales bacterium]